MSFFRLMMLELDVRDSVFVCVRDKLKSKIVRIVINITVNMKKNKNLEL